LTQKDISQLSEREKHILYTRIRDAQEDLFYFGHDILQNDFLVPEVHGELAEFVDGPYWCDGCNLRLPWQLVDGRPLPRLENGALAPIVCPHCGYEMPRRKRFKLVLIPRDCLKTTFLSIIRPLHKLIRDPSRRMLIGSENHQLAMDILGNIKNIILYNEWFIKHFGRLDGSKKGYKWSQEAISIADREDWSAKEHNIETAGVDVTMTGRHFPDIMLDDIHSQKNINSKQQIGNVIDWVKLLMPMLEEDGTMLVVGTRWDDADSYQWMIDLVDETGKYGPMGEKVFDTFIKGAINHDGTAYYGLRNSIPALAQKQVMMGDYLYSCQYDNDPIPKGGAMFDVSQLRTVKPQDIPTNLFKVILVDPASMDVKELMSTNRDDTAIVCLGISPDEDDMLGLRKIYLLDLHFGDWELDQAIEALTSMFIRNRPNVLGIERQGMSTFGTTLLSRIKKRGGYVKIHDLKPKNRNKDDRIRTLSPYVNNGFFYMRVDIDQLSEFIFMLRRFPRGAKRDPLDAAAYLDDILEEFKAALRAGSTKKKRAAMAARQRKIKPVDSLTGW
jgi:predicted phage terminase large subunit-like protein